MEIIQKRPPNFEDIVKVFPMAANKGVIFAFNNKIYNPSNIVITPSLMAHESVHCARQGVTEEESLIWWEQYLTYEDFRYHEELMAHCAEYLNLKKSAHNRQKRRAALKEVSSKLSASLYGGMCSRKKAEKDILYNLNKNER